MWMINNCKDHRKWAHYFSSLPSLVWSPWQLHLFPYLFMLLDSWLLTLYPYFVVVLCCSSPQLQPNQWHTHSEAEDRGQGGCTWQPFWSWLKNIYGMVICTLPGLAAVVQSLAELKTDGADDSKSCLWERYRMQNSKKPDIAVVRSSKRLTSKFYQLGTPRQHNRK